MMIAIKIIIIIINVIIIIIIIIAIINVAVQLVNNNLSPVVTTWLSVRICVYR